MRWPWVRRKRLIEAERRAAEAIENLHLQLRVQDRQLRSMSEDMARLNRMVDAQVLRLMRCGDMEHNEDAGEWGCTVFVGQNLLAELSSRLSVEDQLRFIAHRAGQVLASQIIAQRPGLSTEFPDPRRGVAED